jgi:hypothetical protein
VRPLRSDCSRPFQRPFQQIPRGVSSRQSIVGRSNQKLKGSGQFSTQNKFLFPAVCLSVCVFKLKVYRPSCQKSRRALCLPFLGLFELLIPLPNVIYRVYSVGCSSTTTFGLPE